MVAFIKSDITYCGPVKSIIDGDRQVKHHHLRYCDHAEAIGPDNSYDIRNNDQGQQKIGHLDNAQGREIIQQTMTFIDRHDENEDNNDPTDARKNVLLLFP